MKHNLTLYKDISRQLTACCGYCLMFITILSLYHSEKMSLLYFTGIPLVLAIFMFIERYCYQLVLYILLHGLCFLPFVFLHSMDIYYRNLYLVMLSAESVRAIYIWKKGTDKPYDDVPWHLLTVCIICYLTAHYYHFPVLKTSSYCIGLFILIFHFIRFYITGLQHLTSQSRLITSMPTKRIMSTNLALFAFFILAFLLLIGCNNLFDFEQIFYTAGRFLVKCIRIFLRLILVITAILRAITAKESTLDEISEPAQDLEEAIAEVSKPSLLAEIFSRLFVICFVILLLYLLYRAITKFITHYLYRYARDTDVVVPIKKETGASLKTKKNPTSKNPLRQLFGKTYSERIRIAYRQKISGYKDIDLNKADTAEEIADKINTQYHENIDTLTFIYEKARYSDETVTPDEAKKGGIIC